MFIAFGVLFCIVFALFVLAAVLASAEEPKDKPTRKMSDTTYDNLHKMWDRNQARSRSYVDPYEVRQRYEDNKTPSATSSYHTRMARETSKTGASNNNDTIGVMASAYAVSSFDDSSSSSCSSSNDSSSSSSSGGSCD